MKKKSVTRNKNIDASIVDSIYNILSLIIIYSPTDFRNLLSCHGHISKTRRCFFSSFLHTKSDFFFTKAERYSGRRRRYSATVINGKTRLGSHWISGSLHTESGA